jgi:hypothetical protein
MYVNITVKVKCMYKRGINMIIRSLLLITALCLVISVPAVSGETKISLAVSSIKGESSISDKYRNHLIAQLQKTGAFSIASIGTKEDSSETTIASAVSSGADMLVTGKLMQTTQQADSDTYDAFTNTTEQVYWIDLYVINVRSKETLQNLKDRVQTTAEFESSAKNMANLLKAIYTEKKENAAEQDSWKKDNPQGVKSSLTDNNTRQLFLAPALCSSYGQYKNVVKQGIGASAGILFPWSSFSVISSAEFYHANPGRESIDSINIFSFWAGIGYRISKASFAVIPSIQPGLLFHKVTKSAKADNSEYNGLYINPSLRFSTLFNYQITENIRLIFIPSAGIFFGSKDPGYYVQYGAGLSIAI